MPSSVQAGVRIRAISTAVIAAPCLGPQAVCLRSGRLSQVPTRLGQHSGCAVVPEATQRAYGCSVHQLVPPSEPGWARSELCLIEGLGFSDGTRLRAQQLDRRCILLRPRCTGAQVRRRRERFASPRGSRRSRHDVVKACARADHKLLIVPHRTLDAGGCRSSGESTQLLANLSFCTLLPQLRHGSAINAACRCGRGRIEPRRCVPRLLNG